ncbi:Lar family restriction alleviation protein [Escherichia coli]|nr:Lar family restriction alleviation protein [Escherichia coli]
MTAPHMPMMNDEGLLECPFCGCNDAYNDKNIHGYYVACSQCGCGTDEWLHADSAVKSWNTRGGFTYKDSDFEGEY